MLHYRYWYGEGVRDEGDFDDEEEVYDLRSLLLDVDGFRRVMFGAWNHPAAAITAQGSRMPRQTASGGSSRFRSTKSSTASSLPPSAPR